jgi:hypothetical protein
VFGALLATVYRFVDKLPDIPAQLGFKMAASLVIWPFPRGRSFLVGEDSRRSRGDDRAAVGPTSPKPGRARTSTPT